MTGYGTKFIWRDSDAFSLYSPTEETEQRPENNKKNIFENLLKPPALRRYPVGRIRPCGWLRTQLKLHASGMGGTLDEFWPYIKHSRWFGGYLPDERDVPDSIIYWLDGLIPMAWQLDDRTLQEKCHHYIGMLLNRQQENGWLCPEGPIPEELDKSVHNRNGMFIMSEFTDGWPLFGIMKPLIQYYEATGDRRIPQAVGKALRCLDYLLDKLSLRNWGSLRWSEGLISVYWLYERTREPWLLQLAQKLRCQGFDWNELYRDESTWPYAMPLEQCHWSALNHVVNTAMAVKSGPLCYRISGKEFDFTAPQRMLSLLDQYHGFVTGMFSGDEGFAGKEPIQGSELCGVVELMYSLEEALAVTGELSYADRLEKLAFNSLPAAFNPEMTAHQYVQQINQPQCSRQEWPVYSTAGPESNLFGIEPNFPCCTTQTQGWPKFIQSIFMQAEKGIALLSYAPAQLDTTIEGISVSVELEGEYPFSDEASVSVFAEGCVPFSLLLRVPSWVSAFTATDGSTSYQGTPGSFLEIKKTWSGKSEIRIVMKTGYQFVERPNHLYALVHGPLVYALSIQEKWIQQCKPEAKEKPWLNNWEVYPQSPWNYGFVRNAELHVLHRKPGEYPFSQSGAPIEIRTTGKKIAWTLERGTASPSPSMEWISQEKEEICLIPYGCTCLRMTELPFVE